MKKQMTTFLKVLRYSLSSGKLLTGVLILANILLGLLSAVQVWLIGQITETFGDAFLTGEHLFVCLPYLLGLFALLLAQKLLFSTIPYGRTRLYTRVKQKMTQDLFEAVNQIPPVRQELNEEQVRFGRAVDFINKNFESSFHSVLTLISGFTSMVSVLILLGRYSLLFPLVAVATSLPVVFIRLKQDKAMHAMYREQYPSNQLGADVYKRQGQDHQCSQSAHDDRIKKNLKDSPHALLYWTISFCTAVCDRRRAKTGLIGKDAPGDSEAQGGCDCIAQYAAAGCAQLERRTENQGKCLRKLVNMHSKNPKAGSKVKQRHKRHQLFTDPRDLFYSAKCCCADQDSNSQPYQQLVPAEG